MSTYKVFEDPLSRGRVRPNSC